VVRPAAHGGTVATAAGTPVHATIPVPTGTGPLVSTVVTAPAHGTVTLAADGSYRYTPDPGYTGTDSFTYLVTDPAGDVSAPALITVTVHGTTEVVPPPTGTAALTPPASGPATGTVLPFTGSPLPVGTAVELAAGLLLLGSALVLLARRTRRHRPA
jgi:VCBS repeat-containing protein